MSPTAPDPVYAPYTNDVGGISVGFLVKSTVDTLKVEQFGANNVFIDPRDGSTLQTLNDRPPLILHAGIKRSNAKDYPVTVIVNHLRSLSDENDPSSGVFVRTKKELQAEFLASLIQGYQTAGEHVISVGDYNAFEFSDGYIDILATITNQKCAAVGRRLWNRACPILLSLLLLISLRCFRQPSAVVSGVTVTRKILDHIVATADLVSSGAHLPTRTWMQISRSRLTTDPTTPARTSDHDAAVGYFNLPAPVLFGHADRQRSVWFGECRQHVLGAELYPDQHRRGRHQHQRHHDNRRFLSIQQLRHFTYGRKYLHYRCHLLAGCRWYTHRNTDCDQRQWLNLQCQSHWNGSSGLRCRDQRAVCEHPSCVSRVRPNITACVSPANKITATGTDPDLRRNQTADQRNLCRVAAAPTGISHLD